MAESNQERSERIYQSFLHWTSVITTEELRDMLDRTKTKILRGHISKAINCSTSTLRDHPKLKTELPEWEENLKGVFPKETDEAKANKSKPQQHDQGASQRLNDSKRLASLEKENIELKAELAMYRELKEVLEENGIYA